MESDGSLNFKIRNTSLNTQTVSAGGLSELNTWIHVVGVYNSTDIILYINGIQNNTNTQTGNVTNGTALPLLANSGDSGDKFLEGSLDEIRIYNRSLSSAEITEIFNSGRSANASLPSNELALWYSMNEGELNIVHDLSGNGNNGE